MPMKLSFNTWPYASFPVWLPAYTLEETIKRIKKIGYDGIEIGAASPHCYPPTLSKQRRIDIGQMQRLRIDSSIPIICHGGPIATIEDTRYILANTKGLAGFYGASSVERLPVEVAITENVRGFKELRLNA